MSTNADAVEEGQLLWEPSAASKEQSRIADYMRWLARERGRSFATYAELWRFSVTEIEAFWESIWDYFDVRAKTPYRSVLSSRAMPGASWFEGATLNYAEHALRGTGDVAVVWRRESGEDGQFSWDELREEVTRVRAGLARLGVAVGDTVAAFLPNGPETLIAFLATASLGATWSSASPEFGVRSVLDRFQQIEPKVLIAVDGYVYGNKPFDRSDAIREMMGALPTLEHTVIVQRLGGAVPVGAIAWEDLRAEMAPLEFVPVPFAHPLWILYSSGTTGLPKPIVQGHGGILLEHLKALALHCDLGPKDRFFWFSTTGWMMWNFLVSGLTVGATVVLYEGNPGYPDLATLFRFASECGISYFGTSAPFLLACKKDGVSPASLDLSTLRSVGSTGAPLPADAFGWVYEHVKNDVLLGSVSGGTDVCTAFVTSCPLLPVHAGEIQCAALGAKVEAVDARGRRLVGEVGELVIGEPMPSMPIRFVGDPSGEKLRESYFSDFPGVWRHGDWIKETPRGTFVIYGRSDSTLNRGGVRMGTSEFYRVVESLPGVVDSLVIDTGSLGDEGKLWLFVVPASGASLTEKMKTEIRRALRGSVSPRHVPDVIAAIHEVPRTLNGKKLEVPIKRLLMGVPRERAVNPGTLANAAAVDDVLRAAGIAAG